MTLAEPVLSDITEEWEKIRESLTNLCAKSPEFGLSPDHVREDCMAERADLWITPEGFSVTRFITDEHTNDRTLFLWVSCSFSGNADVGAKYLSFFTEVAKYTDCKYIEAWSSREGMGRYLARQGFNEFYRSYRKTV